MINIPNQNKQWLQPNNSDLFGNVFSTKNITFDDDGYLKLSYAARAAANEDVINDTDWNFPSVIIPSGDHGYFIQTRDHPFSLDSTSILTNIPSDEGGESNAPVTGDLGSDACWFGGLLAVTEDADLHYYNESTNAWTDTNISLTTNKPHPLEHFLSLNALAIGNANTVKLYATPLSATPTLITTLTIPSGYDVTCLKYFNQFLYIGTQNLQDQKAALYVWNGQGTAAQQVYETNGAVIGAIEVLQNSVILLSSSGELLQFTGGGFKQLAAFPIFYLNRTFGNSASSGLTKVRKNMMAVRDDVVYINIGEDGNQDLVLRQHHGIWCYDPKVGLYHRHALMNSFTLRNLIRADTTVDTTDDEITVAVAPATGTPAYFSMGAGSITPLLDNIKYYVIKVDATTIKVAETLADAIAGTAIDLTAATSNYNLYMFPNYDWGQSQLEDACCIALHNNANISSNDVNQNFGWDIVWSANVPARDNADQATIGSLARNFESRGHFITPKIFSSNITDTFNLLTLKFSKLRNEEDKILIKHRTVDDYRDTLGYNSLNAWNITWTSTTTFTTAYDSRLNPHWGDAAVGDEIEVFAGAGAGLLAHITAISESSGTYTVTIDEEYAEYASSNFGRAVFRNWTKLVTISQDDEFDSQGFYSKELHQKGKFIQFKVELRGIGVRIEELAINNKVHLPAK